LQGLHPGYDISAQPSLKALAIALEKLTFSFFRDNIFPIHFKNANNFTNQRNSIALFQRTISIISCLNKRILKKQAPEDKKLTLIYNTLKEKWILLEHFFFKTSNRVHPIIGNTKV